MRSAQSGAPLSTVLARIAQDMRRDRHAAVEVAARSAGVRAVAPLAACFLPAFLLVGVVPVVASLAGARCCPDRRSTGAADVGTCPQRAGHACPTEPRPARWAHDDMTSVPMVGTAAEAAREGDTMRTMIARFVKEEEGLSTAEYAVGTVAAAGLGGVLIKLLTSPEVRDLIWSVLSNAFKGLFG